MPTPSKTAKNAPTARETAPPAPADRGPRPPVPAQPLATYGNDAANRLYAAARRGSPAEAREHVAAVDTLRQPPAVAHYKAALLDWLGCAEAWDAARGA